MCLYEFKMTSSLQWYCISYFLQVYGSAIWGLQSKWCNIRGKTSKCRFSHLGYLVYMLIWNNVDVEFIRMTPSLWALKDKFDMNGIICYVILIRFLMFNCIIVWIVWNPSPAGLPFTLFKPRLNVHYVFLFLFFFFFKVHSCLYVYNTVNNMWQTDWLINIYINYIHLFSS